MEKGAARKERHRLLAGVDQVLVLLPRRGLRADAEHAVLAMQDDLAALRQMVRHQCRQTDAEIHVRSFGNVARDARCHLVAIEFFHYAAFLSVAPTLTTRCTNMPGVTTTSGSSAPISTISRTCTTVQRAALAITGAKLRAVLR